MASAMYAAADLQAGVEQGVGGAADKKRVKNRSF